MKRIRLNKLIISPLFVFCTADTQHALYNFSQRLHSFLPIQISESIADNISNAEVIDIEVFTTIQLPK